MFKELLESVPTTQRIALRLAVCRGLSHREIALETGVSLGITRTRLELGVKKIRAAVVAKGPLELREVVQLLEANESEE